ncbi:hypothetical protein FH972_009478 [Carpinus fangiana]|uniref:Uncharacterized protein n=1 Tax=Carpinus fangiana TaxID=176857 RepID=A0A5N6R215_9ROSI|nr:hypothetical protein FH972_009478 [Carpinus fangiana]
MPAGVRSRTRDLFARPFRKKGYVPLSTMAAPVAFGTSPSVPSASKSTNSYHLSAFGTFDLQINVQLHCMPVVVEQPVKFWWYLLRGSGLYAVVKMGVDNGEWGQITGDIHCLLRTFPQWEMKYARRGTNKVAHALAQFAVSDVGNRLIRKRIHVRVEHVQPSRCREDLKLRRIENDQLKAEAKARGEKISPKRQPQGPKPGFMVAGATLETVTPIPYDVVNDLKGGY